MIPVSFDEENAVLDKPPNMSRDDCEPLNVCLGVMGNAPVIISCWKLTAKELERINETGRVWLTVVGQQMVPVMLSGEKPPINVSESN